MDGKLDFFTANNGTNGNPLNDLLYVNSCTTGNYIGIKLKGCNINKSGIGARVTVKTGATSYIRELTSQGLLSQSMNFLHFGLGNSSIVDSVIVKWTTGNIQRLSNISVNQYITVDECLIGLISNSNEVPEVFSLSQNYPNPFNPSTKIKFTLPAIRNVVLNVFDNLGKEIYTLINEDLKAGYYEYEFDGNNLSSGIYFYKIKAGDYSDTKKMALIK